MFFKLLTRSLRLRRGRFVIAALSVAMGTAVAVTFAGVSLVLGDRLARSLRAYGANVVLLPEGGSLGVPLEGTDYRPPVRTGAIADTVLSRIHDTFWRNNILGYAPELAAVAEVGSGSSSSRLPLLPAGIVGTWFRRQRTTPSGYPFTAGMTTVAPWWKTTGRLPREDEMVDPPECLMGRRLAERSGMRLGQVVNVRLRSSATGGEPSDLALRVVGILDAGGSEDETIYLPIEALQRRLGRPHEVDWVLVSALIKPGLPPAPDPQRDPQGYERWSCTPYVTSVASELDRRLPGVEARPVRQLVEAEGRVVHRLNLLMLLLTLAALVGGALGVMSTLTAATVERTQEFALQRALGATRSGLFGLLAAESLAVGLAGGLAGCALGVGLAAWTGRAAFGLEVPFQPFVVPVGLGAAVIVAALGSWIPLQWALSVSPAEALKP